MKRARFLWIVLGLFGVGVGIMCLPMSTGVDNRTMPATSPTHRLDTLDFSSEPPGHPLDVLFIHHSCGGQLLAAPGPGLGENCILESDPNGGNLRALLQQSGYRLHEASYGSSIGQNTDVFDWLPKFRNQMDEILRCDLQDSLYPDGRRNRVVLFKSCFPNNAFRGEGLPPGNPGGPELTVWNAKAAYRGLLEEFRKQPDVLFVCLTAPPLAPGPETQPLWKHLAKTMKQKLRGAAYDLAASGPLARQFNHWLVDAGGWLKGYSLSNVVVFDYYDTLTDEGASDFSRYATWDGHDSHPSREGNEKAARAFVPFLNRAVRHAQVASR